MISLPDGRGPPERVAVLGSDDGAGDSGVPRTPVLQEQVAYTLHRSCGDYLTFYIPTPLPFQCHLPDSPMRGVFF